MGSSLPLFSASNHIPAWPVALETVVVDVNRRQFTVTFVCEVRPTTNQVKLQPIPSLLQLLDGMLLGACEVEFHNI